MSIPDWAASCSGRTSPVTSSPYLKKEISNEVNPRMVQSTIMLSLENGLWQLCYYNGTCTYQTKTLVGIKSGKLKLMVDKSIDDGNCC